MEAIMISVIFGTKWKGMIELFSSLNTDVTILTIVLNCMLKY